MSGSAPQPHPPASIPSLFSNQAECLAAISALHHGGRPFHVDLTYGNGSFWTGAAAHLKPPVRMDLNPVWKRDRGDPSAEFTEVNLQADARKLPFRNGSVDSIVMDPPFIHAAGKDSIMGRRFGSYPSQKALRQLYWKAGMEMQRCLAPGGLVVWKCQDIVESGKQVRSHISIFMDMTQMGFIDEDLFVLSRSGNGLAGWNHADQQHARKVHSYFWIFRKPFHERV